MEGSLLKTLIALYTLTSVWRRGEREKHTRARALTSPGRAERGVAQSLAGPRPPFAIYFCYEFMSNTF
jgi:hypothetical protein